MCCSGCVRARSCGRPSSGLPPLLDRLLFGFFGAPDLPTRRQALVAEDPQGLDLGTLPSALAVLENLEVARARHPLLVLGSFLGRLGPPEHQQFADVL